MGGSPALIFMSGPVTPILCRARGPCSGTPVRGLTFLEEGVSLLTIGAPIVARMGVVLRVFRIPLQGRLLIQAFSLIR